MFCLPNVSVGGTMDMLRDGCVASETVFVEDVLVYLVEEVFLDDCEHDCKQSTTVVLTPGLNC